MLQLDLTGMDMVFLRAVGRNKKGIITMMRTETTVISKDYTKQH